MAIKIWENINIQTTNCIRSSVSKKRKTLSQRLYDSDEEDYEEHEVAAALQNISEKANNEINNLMQECPEEEIGKIIPDLILPIILFFLIKR